MLLGEREKIYTVIILDKSFLATFRLPHGKDSALVESQLMVTSQYTLKLQDKGEDLSQQST